MPTNTTPLRLSACATPPPGRGLRAARRAPGAPDVDDDDLAAVVGQRERLAVERRRRRPTGLPARSRRRPSVIDAGRRRRSPCRRRCRRAAQAERAAGSHGSDATASSSGAEAGERDQARRRRSSSAPPAEKAPLRRRREQVARPARSTPTATSRSPVEGQRRERASVHCRLRGSCTSRRPSTLSRVIQIGSWWRDDHRLVPARRRRGRRAPRPASARRSPCTARPTTGVNGLHRCRQCRGLLQRRRRRRRTLALEDVARPRSPARRCATVEPARRGQRRGGLLRPLQRRGDEVRRCRGRAIALGDPLGHRAAELGEVVAGQPAVEDAVGVVHLAVAQQVDDGVARLTAAIALLGGGGRARRAGSASATGRSAASSWAAETNHASNARRRQVDARGRASRGRTPRSATASCASGRRRSRAPVVVDEEDAEHVAGGCTPCGTPASVERLGRPARPTRRRRSRRGGRRPRRSRSRSVASPAAVATGFPDSVPAW